MSVLCGFTWLEIKEITRLHVIIFRLILRRKINGALPDDDISFLEITWFNARTHVLRV